MSAAASGSQCDVLGLGETLLADEMLVATEDAMPLFGRGRSVLPATSYGYTSPPEATAHGWQCSDRGCGVREYEPVHRWPKACTQCGTNVDPLFDEPWAHEAERLQLEWELERPPDDIAAHYAISGLIVWRYRDAVQRSDDKAADAARAEAHQYVDRKLASSDAEWFIPGDVHFQIVWRALEHDRLVDAANELAFWSQRLVINNVQDDNSQRTNARQLLSSELRFLKHPRSRQHAARPEVRSRALQHADAIREVLTANHLADLATLR